MNISPTKAWCDEDRLWVELEDGRTLAVPIAWFPRLLAASASERASLELSRRGMHWPDLDEDISVAGLLAGLGSQDAA